MAAGDSLDGELKATRREETTTRRSSSNSCSRGWWNKSGETSRCRCWYWCCCCCCRGQCASRCGKYELKIANNHLLSCDTNNNNEGRSDDCATRLDDGAGWDAAVVTCGKDWD